MRSIEARYTAMRKKYPEQYSSYICFAKAVKWQKFSRESISRWFNILVDKEDYVLSERKGIVSYLHELSQSSEGQEFGNKSHPQDP